MPNFMVPKGVRPRVWSSQTDNKCAECIKHSSYSKKQQPFEFKEVNQLGNSQHCYQPIDRNKPFMKPYGGSNGRNLMVVPNATLTHAVISNVFWTQPFTAIIAIGVYPPAMLSRSRWIQPPKAHPLRVCEVCSVE